MRAVQRIYEVVFGAERIIETLQYGGVIVLRSSTTYRWASCRARGEVGCGPIPENICLIFSYCLGKRAVTLKVLAVNVAPTFRLIQKPP